MLRVAVAASLLIALLIASDASAATCPKGQLAWKAQGRRVCVKPKAVTGVAQPATVTAVERLLLTAVRPAPLGRRSSLSAAARAKFKHAVGAIARRAGTMETQVTKPPAVRTFGAVPAQLAASKTLTSPEFTSGGVTGRVSATVADDGSASIGIEAAVKIGRDTTSIEVDVKPGFDPPTDTCPDADGKVRSKDVTGARLTTKVQRGRRVVSAQTARVTTTTETVGQVGDDGNLQGTSSTVTTEAGSFSRGVGVEIASTVTVSGGTTGGFTPTGSPSTSAKVRVNGATSAQERAAERSIAADEATSGNLGKSAGQDAARGRARVKEKEAGWTSLERNPCIDVAWDPGVPGALEPGQTATVTGRIVRKDGKPAAATGRWTVVSQGPGTFAGPGPVFTAKGEEPSGTGLTVIGVVVVASRSGRVQAPWYAKGSGLPATFSATMTQHEDMSSSGVVVDFDATATWTRRSVDSHPDGSRTAWYDIVSGTTTRWVYDQTTGGCGYHGEGAGGTPVFGDVELRIAADGTVAYGFVVDIDAGNPVIPKSSGPPGCPASISPRQKDIVQARAKPASTLYAAPPGALQKTSFDVTAAGVTDSIGDSDGFRDLTTGWTLTGR